MSVRRKLATTIEVADFLGVPVRTLERWRRYRTGPQYAPIGRHVRYRWEDVEKWLDQQATEVA
jgi:excisionase family DNA binding protein